MISSFWFPAYSCNIQFPAFSAKTCSLKLETRLPTLNTNESGRCKILGNFDMLWSLSISVKGLLHPCNIFLNVSG